LFIRLVLRVSLQVRPVVGFSQDVKSRVCAFWWL